MAKFKCVHSGCVYEWTEPEMVENMRLHAEYTEIVAGSPTASAPVAANKEAVKPLKPKKEVK